LHVLIGTRFFRLYFLFKRIDTRRSGTAFT